jgi:hypothetical protein
MPSRLNVEQVQVVQALDNPFSNYDFQLKQLLGVNLVGLNTFTGIEAAPAVLHSPVVPLVDTQGKEARVIANNFRITFDAAGALAFNTKSIVWQTYLSKVGAVGSVNVAQGIISVITAKLIYPWSINGQIEGPNLGFNASMPTRWQGMIPSGFSYVLQFDVLDGTNFPANTTLQKFIGVNLVGQGQEPPQ